MLMRSCLRRAGNKYGKDKSTKIDYLKIERYLEGHEHKIMIQFEPD